MLLTEDDKLFALLFTRFWKERFPHVKIELASSVSQGKAVLAEKGNPPRVAILDMNLSDGCSTELLNELPCPHLLWTAMGEGEIGSKPKGKKELEAAVERIGTLGGIDSSL